MAQRREDEIVISGARTNNTTHGGLPTGRFDWCYACALTAFSALAMAPKGAE